jgi:hypothetical protein
LFYDFAAEGIEEARTLLKKEILLNIAVGVDEMELCAEWLTVIIFSR